MLGGRYRGEFSFRRDKIGVFLTPTPLPVIPIRRLNISFRSRSDIYFRLLRFYVSFILFLPQRYSQSGCAGGGC